jgi:hypothetical protein
MKTLAFYAVFGVVEGYHHNNIMPILTPRGLERLPVNNESNLKIVSKAWQEAMQDEFDTSGVLVSAVLSESNTVYSVGFGCPEGGEKTVTVNGHFNPKFIKKKPGFSENSSARIAFTAYHQAVVRVCNAVKKELKQTTVSIAFYDLDDFVYLADKR